MCNINVFSMLSKPLGRILILDLLVANLFMDSLSAKVYNKRREGEYPTSIVWPNALNKVMM